MSRRHSRSALCDSRSGAWIEKPHRNCSRSMLKIERSAGNGDVVFMVSGRLESDSVGQLSALVAAENKGRALVLDLKDLLLVDREVVRFLRTCEGQGILLRNCPPYVRAWMACQEDRP